MTFETELHERKERIEEIIKGYLPEEEGFQKTIMEAMNYSVLAGGKRVRPMLMQETYRLFGGEGKVIEPFMAAMEMIQSYSLVHDDLPALDNDEYRRGKKSTHAQFGEAMGILAGDALLNYAFELAASAFDIDCSENTARALQIFSRKAGIYGMIGGQVVDVQSEGQEISKEKLEFIHRLKCGALIEACMQMGAVLAGATEEEIEKIEHISADVGYAFQIQDDILDVIGTEEVIGKPVGSDEKNDKVTYVTMYGIEKAKKDVEEMSDRALSELASLDHENKFLSELIKHLINRTN